MDGSSQPPPQVVPNPSTELGAPKTMSNPEYLTWIQRDQMILNVLISTLTEPFVIHVVGCAIAYDLSTTLVIMFSSQSCAWVMQVHYQLAMSKNGSSSIMDYFQKIKGLGETLAAAGQPLNYFESVSYLLIGLGSEYDHFVTSITARVDPLSLEEIYGHLLAHEMHIEHNVPSVEPTQPFAHYTARTHVPRGRGYRGRNSSYGGRSSYHGRGYSSQGLGRGSYFPPNAPSSSHLVCQICGKVGHTTVTCYQRHDPPSTKSLSSPQAFYSSPNISIDEN